MQRSGNLFKKGLIYQLDGGAHDQHKRSCCSMSPKHLNFEGTVKPEAATTRSGEAPWQHWFQEMQISPVTAVPHPPWPAWAFC